jgi:uncharacterized repeat protein (TIGR01451 family)
MGSYSVGVTDGTGCTGVGYAHVAQVPVITPTVVPTPATCTAHDGAVIAFGSGGVPPYTYLWSNGATTQTQTGLPSGYYGVTTTDANGCIGNSGAWVSVFSPIMVSYSTTPSLCTSNTGTATLSITGGTGPYTITWYTTPIQTTTTAVNLAPGNVSFHVVDAVGCMQDGTVTVPPINIISTSFTSTAPMCTMSNGAITAIPTGGATPYTYHWSTGATTSGITSVPAGYYTVDITDNAGCTVHPYHYLYPYSPLSLGLSETAASCIFTNDGSITATPYGGTGPYSYSWTNGGTTSTISSLYTGPYWVSVTDAAGCTAYDYDYLPYNTAGTSCYCTISGTVYDDANANCNQDAGEAGIHNIQIHIESATFSKYTYTDASGHYSMIVPSGTYTVTETVLAFYPLSPCQANGISVTAVAGTGCVHTVDFGNSITTIHDMHVSTWDYNYAVPGHVYHQVTVITNDGTVSEPGILAGYNTDGQIFAPSTIPSGIFTGSTYWYNTPGTFPTLTPGTDETFYMDYNVPTTIPLGTNVLFKDTVAYTTPITNWLTDYSPWNNVNYFTALIRSSYDPNFKEVSPKGTGPTGIISYTDSILEYMVHFQNTGSYMAENIVVIDTLDDNLDWTTLKPVYQSAPCKITLEQSGSKKVAKFNFANINLPTQVSNDLRSNGMFTYTIHIKPGLPVGTTFNNSASIYFDYNAPVKTNGTINTLGTSSAVSNLVASVSSADQSAFTVYPNPASNSFSAIINSLKVTDGGIKVSDVTGKVLMTKTVALQRGTQSINVDASQLASGVYFVTLDANGKTQTQKLVIIK